MRLGREPRRSTCHRVKSCRAYGPILAWVDWMAPPASAGTSSGLISVSRMDSSVRPTASSNSSSATTQRMRCWMRVLGMPALTP